MGNAQGHHGDHLRKHSGHHGGTEGLTFGDRIHGRETSPFDPIGPVDITKDTTKIVKDASPQRNQQPARAHRPRSTTESGPRRYVSIDYPGTRNETDGEKIIIKPIGSPEEKGQKKLPTIIKYAGQGKDVYLCGTFNGWQKLRMSRSHKDFVAMIELGEGDHEYKFLVDGQWITDPNAATIENNAGFKNNIIHVQKEDFDAFEALDMDLATVTKAQSHKAAKANQVKPQDKFGQEMPHLVNSSGIPVSGTTGGTGNESRSSGPPILPPHLLQVILNKDTPLSCEPTLLPEPNHVMLNHLYALSIKDGVMVLSTTQRFKRKYITTLLYKPMGTRTSENI